MENIKNVLVMAERENKTVYRDGDRTIKVFKDNYCKSDVMNEAFNQAVIEELGMNVPAFLEIRLVDGKLVTVSQYVEGRTLDEIMEEDKENFDRYLDMFVSLQVEFHSKETTALTRLRDKLHEQIRKCEQQSVTICIHGLKICRSTTRYATGTLTPPMLFSEMTENFIFSTGPMPLRETLQVMP